MEKFSKIKKIVQFSKKLYDSAFTTKKNVHYKKNTKLYLFSL